MPMVIHTKLFDDDGFFAAAGAAGGGDFKDGGGCVKKSWVRELSSEEDMMFEMSGQR